MAFEAFTAFTVGPKGAFVIMWTEFRLECSCTHVKYGFDFRQRKQLFQIGKYIDSINIIMYTVLPRLEHPGTIS